MPTRIPAIHLESEAELPTRFGKFRIYVFCSPKRNNAFPVLVRGDVRGARNVLVRVHSKCLTGDTFGSNRCDCQDQLHMALRAINQRGKGMLIYLMQEGRGIGLANKIQAYHLQDQGLDTAQANEKLGFRVDHREYGEAAAALAFFGVHSLDLLTNNPGKISDLKRYGVRIARRIALTPKARKENKGYLEVKRRKLGHLLPRQ